MIDGNRIDRRSVRSFFLSLSLVEEACDLVMEHIGVSTLFDVCRFSCQTTGTDGEQLRVMTLGALHNIINSNGNHRSQNQP